MYCVRIISTPKVRRYGQLGGGTFMYLNHALERCGAIKRRGGDCKVYVTDCNWKEVDQFEGIDLR